MSSGSELSLDFKPFFTPKPVSEFLRDISSIVDCKKRLSKLEYYLNSLEEERTKIVLFKRELPLCLLLLNDAIEDVRNEEIRCRKRVLEHKLDEDGGIDLEKDCTDKMNWMSSAQLWIDDYNNSKNDNIYDMNKKNKAMDLKEKEDSDASANEYLFSGSKYRNGGGALLSFKGSSAFPLRKEEESMLPSSDLSLVSTGIKNTNHESGAFDLNSKNSSKPPSSLAAVIQLNSEQPLARKTRRSWSPELHRRFVNALQQLGGSQVATPKQIREVMKVDGLTNDEVKSHLQKYRLHTRRLPATSAPTIGNQKFVISQGVWVPHEQYLASKQRNSQSSSPQGPLQLAGSALGISTTISDSAEDDDVESETCSWKEHLQRSSNEETE